MNKIRKFFGLFRLYNFEKDSSIFHFCQCYYAVEHLKEKGITENIAYLSDYLNSAFIEKQDNFIEIKGYATSENYFSIRQFGFQIVAIEVEAFDIELYDGSTYTIFAKDEDEVEKIKDENNIY